MTATEEFAFLLALELGEENPHAMMARMPAETFRAWQQCWQKYPFGAHGEWIRNAQLQCTIANFAPFRGKDAKVFEVADFMPPDPAAKAKPGLSEHDRLMLGARAMGARVIGGGRVNHG